MVSLPIWPKNPTQKAVLQAMANALDKGLTEATFEHLEAATGRKRPTISEAVTKLGKAGWLRVARGSSGGGVNSEKAVALTEDGQTLVATATRKDKAA